METNGLDCTIKYIYGEANMVDDHLSKYAMNSKTVGSLNPNFRRTKGILMTNKLGLSYIRVFRPSSI